MKLIRKLPITLLSLTIMLIMILSIKIESKADDAEYFKNEVLSEIAAILDMEKEYEELNYNPNEFISQVIKKIESAYEEVYVSMLVPSYEFNYPFILPKLEVFLNPYTYDSYHPNIILDCLTKYKSYFQQREGYLFTSPTVTENMEYLGSNNFKVSDYFYSRFTATLFLLVHYHAFEINYISELIDFDYKPFKESYNDYIDQETAKEINDYDIPFIPDPLIDWAIAKANGLSTGDLLREKLNDVATMMFEGTVGEVGKTWQEAADIVTSYILDRFSPNMETFYSFFGIDAENPQDDGFIKLFFYIGITIAILLLGWNIFLMFFGPVVETRDGPVKLFIRFTMVLFGIIFSFQITATIFNLVTLFWDYIMDISLTGAIASNSFFPLSTVTRNFSGIGTILGIIISLVAGWILFKNYIRLFLEVIERYLVTSFLALCFPIGVATAVGSSTSAIWRSYLRMLFSQLFLMVMNIWFNRMFFRLLLYSPSGSNSVQKGVDDILWFFFIIAFLRVAQRLDSYMASLGLNVAQTGGGILDSIAGAVYMIGSGLSLVKNGSQLGARIAGKGLEKAAVSTGKVGLMKASSVATVLGGSKLKGSAEDRLMEGQISKGITPSMKIDDRMWNKMAMGGFKSASGLSSDTLKSAVGSFMGGQFIHDNKHITSLNATRNGTVINGISSIGTTADGQDIEAGFTLSRQADRNAHEYTDINGNKWYQKYGNNDRPINDGDSVFTDAPNFEQMTGIDMQGIYALDKRYTSNDYCSATKTPDGWAFKDINNNVICNYKSRFRQVTFTSNKDKKFTL